MKIFSLVFVLTVLTLNTSASEFQTAAVDSSLYYSIAPDDVRGRLISVDQFADSLPTKKSKKYLTKLDSIAMVSLASDDLLSAVYTWENVCQWYSLSANQKGRVAMLNQLFETWNQHCLPDPLQNYLEEKLLNEFILIGDQEKLNALQNSMYSRKLDVADAKADSLSHVAMELEQKLLEANKKMEKTATQLNDSGKMITYGGIVAGALILILLIVVIILASRKRYTVKSGDEKSDSGDLRLQIDQLSSEKEQLKKVASSGIDKLNQMDKAVQNALNQLSRTTDDLEDTVQESGNLIESSRNELPVSLYLSQKNLVQRISSQLIGEFRKVSSTLRDAVK